MKKSLTTPVWDACNSSMPNLALQDSEPEQPTDNDLTMCTGRFGSTDDLKREGGGAEGGRGDIIELREDEYLVQGGCVLQYFTEQVLVVTCLVKLASPLYSITPCRLTVVFSAKGLPAPSRRCAVRDCIHLSVPAFCVYSYCHRRQSCRARASPDCDHPGNEISANSYLEYRNCVDVWIYIHVMAFQHRVSRLSGVEPGLGSCSPPCGSSGKGPPGRAC